MTPAEGSGAAGGPPGQGWTRPRPRGGRRAAAGARGPRPERGAGASPSHPPPILGPRLKGPGSLPAARFSAGQRVVPAAGAQSPGRPRGPVPRGLARTSPPCAPRPTLPCTPRGASPPAAAAPPGRPARPPPSRHRPFCQYGRSRARAPPRRWERAVRAGAAEAARRWRRRPRPGRAGAGLPAEPTPRPQRLPDTAGAARAGRAQVSCRPPRNPNASRLSKVPPPGSPEAPGARTW